MYQILLPPPLALKFEVPPPTLPSANPYLNISFEDFLFWGVLNF